MMDQIARIFTSLLQFIQLGQVHRVKEVTPRPEEGRDSSAFKGVQLMQPRERKGYMGKKRKSKRGRPRDQQGPRTGEGGKEGQINILV